MQYIVSFKNANDHFIDIEFIIDNINKNEIEIQLPAWRPGRYELGNFAKNIQKFGVFNEKKEAIHFQKTNKDKWIVKTEGTSKIHVKYNYFAVDLNAGSTYLDGDQLYINPVNCFMYVPERMHEECKVKLDIPSDYDIACGLKRSGNELISSNFDELADSPFITSNSLKKFSFQVEDITFHLCFQGECKPDVEKLKIDFTKFIKEQLSTMQHFPVKEYYFLFQVLLNRFYHGVEHITSTVIALGPGYKLMQGDTYEDLLGVSSHELFHVWNIKTIRPAEMFPYDFTKENYSRLGYVCEGITTYYGDLFLLRSKVFTEEQYFKTFNQQLQKHFGNF